MTVPTPSDWFRFSETSGLAFANEIVHVPARDGTGTAGVTAGAAGLFDNGVQFPAAGNSYNIEIANSGIGSAFDWGSNDFTLGIAFSLEQPTGDAAARLFGRGGNASNVNVQAYIHDNPPHYLGINVYDSLDVGYTLIIYDVDWSTRVNEWHTLFVSKIGTTVNAYIDGIFINSMTHSGLAILRAPKLGYEMFRIGGEHGAHGGWRGKLDNFVHWHNVGLTAEQIAEFHYLTLDNDPPIIQNQSPAADSEDQPSSSDIYLEIDDVDGIVVQSTILVEINNDGGGWDTAYNGSTDLFYSPYDGVNSLITAVGNGYAINIDPDPDIGQNKTVEVRVTAEDNNANVLSPTTYTFYTGAPPYFINLDPYSGETDVGLTSNIGMDILDDGLGVDPTTVSGYVNLDDGNGLQLAYNGSSFLSPFSGSFSEITPGSHYRLTINPDDDFLDGATISVEATALDVNGNEGSTSYSFSTILDDEAPYLQNQDPAALEELVHLDADIYFEVVDDLMGVDISTLTIQYNYGSGWVTMYTSGSWQPGFSGTVVEDPIEGINQYNVTISTHPELPDDTSITVRVTAYDLANVPNQMISSWLFTTWPIYTIELTGESPEPNHRLGIRSSINFSLVDAVHSVVKSSIIISLNGVVAYTSSAFSSGYSGTVTTNGSGGYVVSVTKDTVWDNDIPVIVRIQASNDLSGTIDTSYILYTETAAAISGLVYNIYYRTNSKVPWKLANAEPLPHSEVLNTYTIHGLAENVIYEVAVVPGVLSGDTFIPLISQPIGNKTSGATELEVVKTYPYHKIKTFAP